VIRHGERWWSWSATQGRRTDHGRSDHRHGRGDGAPLADPPALLGELVLTVAAADRAAITAVAGPRTHSGNHPGPRLLLHEIGAGADAYHWTVDRERGLLLCSEALVADQPLPRVAVTHVRDDEEPPESTFDPARLGERPWRRPSGEGGPAVRVAGPPPR